MLVSFVVVEYNSLEDIARCVESIRGIGDLQHEIIVSSNSLYPEAEQKRLEEAYPDVRWVFNPRNGGFAYAMNAGLAVARGNLMAITNPDCVFRSGLGEMAAFLAEHPGLGAIAPRIVDSDGVLQDSAREYVTPWRFIKRQAERVLRHKEVVATHGMDYSRVQTADWVIGAFILVTRRAYELTGGLSDDYFMYAEDLDWCTRIRKAGLEICYYPEAEIQYKGTRSARHSGKYLKIFLKSHLLYWRRFGWRASSLPHRRELEAIVGWTRNKLSDVGVK